MKKIALMIPLLALAACEGSIASAVGDTVSSKGGMTDGTPISTSAIDPGEFDGLTLAGPDNIVFTKGDDYSIRAEGDEDAIEHLRYKISNGQIKIGREGSSWSYNDKATIFVSAPTIASAKLAGSGDMTVDTIDGDDTKLSIAGSGDIKVANVDAKSLTSKIAGSGDMALSGQSESIDISIAGSGKISAKDLTVEKAEISIAGSGDVELSSDGEVEAKVMGSGDVRVHGDAECKSKAMGSGNITCG